MGTFLDFFAFPWMSGTEMKESPQSTVQGDTQRDAQSDVLFQK